MALPTIRSPAAGRGDSLRVHPGAVLAVSSTILATLTVAFALATLLGVVPSIRAQSVLYLALMIGVSLPHGGYEHVANLRGRGEEFRVRYLAAYVGLLAVALGAFAVSPVGGLLLAVAVTTFKGGHGGLHVLATYAGADHLRARWQRALAVAVRGGAVMALGLAFHPSDFTVIASEMVRVFGGTLDPLRPAFTDAGTAALAGTWGALAAVHLLAGRARGGSRGWRVDAAETVLLGSYFAVVPPVVAVGVYFPVWYAGRQVARMAVAGDAPGRGVVLRPALARFLRAAALPWIGGVVVFGAVVLVTLGPSASPVELAALYSVAVAAIAVPHVVVGGWLDRKQGIWSVAA